MKLEQILITAVLGAVGALAAVVAFLYKKVDECQSKHLECHGKAVAAEAKALEMESAFLALRMAVEKMTGQKVPHRINGLEDFGTV